MFMHAEMTGHSPTLDSNFEGSTPQNLTSERMLSIEEEKFWNGEPPDRIIFASSSLRKALQLFCMLNNLLLPGVNAEMYAQKAAGKGSKSVSPMALQEWFNEHIHNGDGTLKESVYLGRYNGVPVWVEPSDGETPGNNPLEEARNKAHALVRKYKGENYLIFAVDTVDMPDTVQQQLGKPMNLSAYPRYRLGEKAARLGSGLRVAQRKTVKTQRRLERARKTFLEDYKREHYKPGTQVIHTNGIYVIGTENGQSVELEVTLDAEVTASNYETIQIFADCGGGGVFQQLIDWTEENLLEQIGDALAQKELGKLKPDHLETIKWHIYCQIIGMPFYAVQEAVRRYISTGHKQELRQAA